MARSVDWGSWSSCLDLPQRAGGSSDGSPAQSQNCASERILRQKNPVTEGRAKVRAVSDCSVSLRKRKGIALNRVLCYTLGVETWLTTGEIAERAGVSAARVRQLVAEGRFSGAVKAGRDWLVPKTAVDRWLSKDRDRRFAHWRKKGDEDEA